jgi:hypothetical protein
MHILLGLQRPWGWRPDHPVPAAEALHPSNFGPQYINRIRFAAPGKHIAHRWAWPDYANKRNHLVRLHLRALAACNEAIDRTLAIG